MCPLYLLVLIQINPWDIVVVATTTTCEMIISINTKMEKQTKHLAETVVGTQLSSPGFSLHFVHCVFFASWLDFRRVLNVLQCLRLIDAL